ncbi:hypothetical protein CH341_06270 [Rhodoplanes roseus]|uniref:Uncharacterized protein n=2 Tax=Rhodoplanes roseus TaxID=29409 RepID=A0A327L4V9_9BRAD|nr:hypothetical protein CH341_06270 [Rhodoplanes roseus]
MGRACLDVETIARGRVANPALFDHVISFENRCLKPIKVQVCVYKTADQCTSLEIPGMKRKDAVLGVGSGSQIIRYTISERR